MLNHKHLYYFWTVARQGGIARAGEQLHLTPQTISSQLSLLEEQLGTALFDRVGRGLQLTEAGRLAMSYADEIFSLSGEMQEMIRNRPGERSILFRVGVADVVPKSIAHRLLTPALGLQEQVRIVCREGDLESLLAELSVHRIDLVIADGPIPPHLHVRGFNHPLGDCGISFFAAPGLAKSVNKPFPECLSGLPFLIPGEGSVLRTQLLNWFDRLHLHPRIAGEFDDSALMKAFGRGGAGIFIAPSPIS
ncbi:MAG: transcriptional activator NhaR, partial [Gammaproteobacteria bacterium]|nr:transcriptional activator NhaR [Gammaproteobacteria bacterium]